MNRLGFILQARDAASSSELSASNILGEFLLIDDMQVYRTVDCGRNLGATTPNYPVSSAVTIKHTPHLSIL